jgi:hypothetical protein
MRMAGIVTLCRTDLVEAALLLGAIASEYQDCTSVVRATYFAETAIQTAPLTFESFPTCKTNGTYPPG